VIPATYGSGRVEIASLRATSRVDSYKMATRIKARAIQRQGQLLSEIEAQPGKRTDRPNAPRDTRSEIARQAGLSAKQRVTALRVAAVPKADFEKAVESEKPPSTA
jgi:hypothetical protein